MPRLGKFENPVNYDSTQTKKREQAGCFVINITKCGLVEEKINKQAESVFSSYYTRFVDAIIWVKGDRILRILKRK